MTRQRLIGAAVLLLALFVVRAAGADTPTPHNDMTAYLEKDAAISVPIFQLAAAVAITHDSGYPCHAVNFAVVNSHRVMLLGCDHGAHMYGLTLTASGQPVFKVIIQK